MHKVNKKSSAPQPKHNQKTNQNKKPTQTTTQEVKKPKTPQPCKTKKPIYQFYMNLSNSKVERSYVEKLKF